MKQSTSKGVAGWAGALVVLGILVAVNVLFAGVRLRMDMTEERLYTLSAATIEMLQGLERPVTLKFYFSKDNPNVPAPLKNFVQRTLDFLREAATRSGGRLSLEVWNPKPDSEAEEWAQRYGLAAQSTGGLGLQPDLYLGLVAVSGAKEASIPFMDPTLEPRMEYLLARLIQEVVQRERPRLGILSSLPVLAPPVSPFMPPAGNREDWLFVSELKKQYEVVPVAPEADRIPEGIGTLLVIHPKDLGEKTWFAIDQFLLNGGRLFAFVDPVCVSEEVPADAPGMPQISSDLNRLSTAWGITMDANQVVADLAAATPVNLGGGLAERLPAWLSLRAGVNIDRAELSTAPLENLMMPFAGSIQGTPAEGLTLAPLVFASSNSVVLNSFEARSTGALNIRHGRPAPAAALAVRLTGTFSTAFPDGPPAAADSAESEAGNADWLKTSAKDGAVILVADVDLLANRFSAQALNFFGNTLYQPINDNLNFTLNAVEQLSGSPALIQLRSRGKFDHPFVRVLAMEQSAQEQWQEQEQRLQQKLQETQQRINKLQAVKSSDQQLVLSPEQKAEVEKFRLERFETQRQLKEVRKNLRSSIERLGLTLKIINMAAVPLLVALFGLGWGWHRRKQAAA